MRDADKLQRKQLAMIQVPANLQLGSCKLEAWNPYSYDAHSTADSKLSRHRQSRLPEQ